MTTAKPSDLMPFLPLLAQSDAIFEPVRDWSNRSAVVAIFEARQDFEKHGLPYLVGGSGAERERGRSLAERQEKGGLVKFYREGPKRVGWKLTDAGDWLVRDLCLLDAYKEMLAVLQALAIHVESGHHLAGMVPEDSLCGPYDHHNAKARILRLEEAILPALVRGLADSHSDSQGRVWYGLTKAGRKFLEAPKRPAVELPVHDDAAWKKVRQSYLDAADTYRVAATDHRRRLESSKPRTSNNVVIPMSCGLGPERDATWAPIVNADARFGKLRRIGTK